MKNKIYLALLCVACSSAYAAHGNEAPLPVSNDVNVTAPEQSGAWSFGVTAVLMQPTNSGYEYAITDQFNANDPIDPSVYGDTIKTSILNENYYWWFGADITYAFPGNSRDVTLAYEGLHGTTTDNASNNFNNDVAQSSIYYSLVNPITNNDVASIQAETDTRYDAGDLLFGQKLTIGQRIQLHPFIGVRYTHIDVQDSFKDTMESFPSEGAEGGNESGNLGSTFNGIGPRLGSDAGIILGKGFSIRGRLGLSALIGSEKSNYNYVSTYLFSPPSTIVPFTQTVNRDISSKTMVVPELDGRLGLNYKHSLNSTMDLGVEAGWQATNYFQVINDPMLSSPGGTPAHDKYSDFGLQGPYARVQLDIA